MSSGPFAALIELVAENSESLRSLTTPRNLKLKAESVALLRQAAPLCKLHCRVKCVGAEAVALLNCELVCPFFLQVDYLNTQQLQTDFAAALASRTGVNELWLILWNFAGGAALEDLARAMVAAGVEGICFGYCGLTPLALPALTLLLRSSVLRSFIIINRGVPLFTGPDLPAFCDALRSNSSPNVIHVHSCVFGANPADAGMVLVALAARTTPFNLDLRDNRVGETQEEQFAAGTQLAQLITAGKLATLQLFGCDLGEAGLAPIFKALSRSTRISMLSLVGEVMRREFARYVVLPSVRANNSLLKLTFCRDDGDEGLLPELLEAQGIVSARRNV